MLYLAECGYEYEGKGVHMICNTFEEAVQALRNLVHERSKEEGETPYEWFCHRDFSIVAMEIGEAKAHGYWWGEWEEGELVFTKPEPYKA